MLPLGVAEYFVKVGLTEKWRTSTLMLPVVANDESRILRYTFVSAICNKQNALRCEVTKAQMSKYSISSLDDVFRLCLLCGDCFGLHQTLFAWKMQYRLATTFGKTFRGNAISYGPNRHAPVRLLLQGQ
jgi:hypothetical protein